MKDYQRRCLRLEARLAAALEELRDTKKQLAKARRAAKTTLDRLAEKVERAREQAEANMGPVLTTVRQAYSLVLRPRLSAEEAAEIDSMKLPSMKVGHMYVRGMEAVWGRRVKTVKPSSILLGLFTWNKSPSGHARWENVFRRLEREEDA